MPDQAKSRTAHSANKSDQPTNSAQQRRERRAVSKKGLYTKA